MIFNLIKRAKELFFDNSKSGLEATDVQGAIDEVNNKLNNIGTVYKNKINSVVTVYAREAFNPITIPAGTYIVTMFMSQSEDARAMSWLEVNGSIQLTEHDNYMLCTCNNEIQGTSTRVCVFDAETTLKMYNGSGHDYKIAYGEISATRIK